MASFPMATRARGFFGFEDAADYAASLLPHTTHAGAFVFDSDYVLKFAEGVVLRDRGYTPEVVVGCRADDVLPAVIWASLKPMYDRTLTGEPFVTDYEGTNKRLYRMHGYPVLGPDDSVEGGLLVVHEAVNPAEQRLTQRLRQQAAIAELGGMALTRQTDLADLIRAAVRFVVETLPAADAAGVGELLAGGERFRTHEMGSNLPGSEFPVAGSLFMRVLDAGHPLVLVDDGSAQFPSYFRDSGFVTVAAVPIGMRDAPVGTVAAFARQVTAFSEDDLHFMEALANILAEAVRREQTDAELRRNALHDVVTGLPNRQLLDDRLNHTLAVSRRAGLGTAVLFIDLDRFKVINDSLGHHAGDEALRSVAARLRSAVRSSDTVARFGGDEFVITAAAIEEAHDAIRIAEGVLAMLEAPILLGNEHVYVRASIGICIASSDADHAPDALIREADAAMYRAKARGRNRYELVDSTQPLVSTNQVIVERDLRQALADGDLRLVFQPLVRLEDGAPIGAEVLLRWQHPTEGYIKPNLFLDVAEQAGLIVPIGEWTLNHACRHAARWHENREFLLTINLSATQLSDPGIVNAVRTALNTSGLRPECLGLELTEQVLVGDEQDALRALTQLKGLGVTLLLDDFGTGFSSLSHLKRFPIDIVKIDRSFIEGLGHPDSGGDDAAIVSAIVGMSRATGKRVIPEGIETAAQVQALLELGCDSGQGYFFSCPMKVRHFSQYLAGEAEPLHAA